MTTQTLTRHALTIRPITIEPTSAQKGWHSDPFGQHKMRFHDGLGWTDHTTHHGPVPCQGCAR